MFYRPVELTNAERDVRRNFLRSACSGICRWLSGVHAVGEATNADLLGLGNLEPGVRDELARVTE